MRNRKSRYVFGTAVASVVVGGIPSLLNTNHAGVLADINFEGGRSARQASTAGNLFHPLRAETGAPPANRVHSNTTGCCNPARDVSPFPFSSNAWNTGDYYAATGSEEVMFSHDQLSSSTASKAFLFRANPIA